MHACTMMHVVCAGVSPGEGTGATMSDDEDDQAESNANLYEGSLDGGETLGFGPLVPTESERSLMERVRHELKHELKQVTNKLGIIKAMLDFNFFKSRKKRKQGMEKERRETIFFSKAHSFVIFRKLLFSSFTNQVT